MIYIVEDDANIRELVSYALSSSGMETEGFDVPSAFWNAINVQLPDLIMLDIMLPEEDGLSILRRLKENNKTKNIPVIMLTAKGFTQCPDSSLSSLHSPPSMSLEKKSSIFKRCLSRKYNNFVG